MYINKFKKIVIKIGSSSIIDEKTGKVKIKWLNSLCKEIELLANENKKIVIVSSGAIALGQNYLKVKKKRIKIHDSDLVIKNIYSNPKHKFINFSISKFAFSLESDP